jgi:hypothetical protein
VAAGKIAEIAHHRHVASAPRRVPDLQRTKVKIAATKPSRGWFYLWLLVSLAWIGFIGWQSYQHWPMVPLDMSTLDPETRQIYTEALIWHGLNTAIVGLGLPFIFYLLGRFTLWRSPRTA